MIGLPCTVSSPGWWQIRYCKQVDIAKRLVGWLVGSVWYGSSDTCQMASLKNEDDLSNENELQNEDDLKNEDDMKNRDNIKNEDNLKREDD